MKVWKYGDEVPSGAQVKRVRLHLAEVTMLEVQDSYENHCKASVSDWGLSVPCRILQVVARFGESYYLGVGCLAMFLI